MAGAPELIFVGIDVSKATLEVALNDRDKTQTFSNDEPGLKSLLAMLAEMRERVGVVLLEATGGLEQPAAAMLCAHGLAVMVINPRQAHDFAKAMGYLAKTDRTDAKMLSQFARTLHASDRRERLLYKLPTDAQETLLAMVTRRSQLTPGLPVDRAAGLRRVSGAARWAAPGRTSRSPPRSRP